MELPHFLETLYFPPLDVWTIPLISLFGLLQCACFIGFYRSRHRPFFAIRVPTVTLGCMMMKMISFVLFVCMLVSDAPSVLWSAIVCTESTANWWGGLRREVFKARQELATSEQVPRSFSYSILRPRTQAIVMCLSFGLWAVIFCFMTAVWDHSARQWSLEDKFTLVSSYLTLFLIANSLLSSSHGESILAMISASASSLLFSVLVQWEVTVFLDQFMVLVLLCGCSAFSILIFRNFPSDNFLMKEECNFAPPGGLIDLFLVAHFIVRPFDLSRLLALSIATQPLYFLIPYFLEKRALRQLTRSKIPFMLPSFVKILDDEELMDALGPFFLADFATENLLFWQSVHRLMVTWW